MIAPEQVTVSALREWLVFTLPARVASINATRGAQLKSASAGPFVLNGVLKLSAVGLDDATPLSINFSGTYTADDIAFAVNSQTPGFVGSVDSWGRLVLTAPAPIDATGSTMCALAGPLNAVFGWSTNGGGEVVHREWLVAPSWRGVMDGQPLPQQDLGDGFWVIIGDRAAQSNVGTDRGNRRSIFDVTVHVDVMRSLGMNQSPLRDREAISACVRAVREVICDDATKRQLGRAAFGDIIFADVSTTAIAAQAFQANQARGSFYFDVAGLEVTLRVNQPAAGP
jgi:hypothetical protein